mmetsp:Transcript_57021/g.133792  ORF Transcript_57021/g.133792 Transcript_57021/m.133792 type:complete len:297 (-) Transcript_57021:149-1039(-)
MRGVELLRRGLARVRDPRVVQALLRRVPLRGVHDQDLGDDVLGALRDLVPVRRGERVLALADLLEQHRRRVVVEGREPAQHDVEHHAQRPEIDLGPVAIGEGKVRVEHLRSHVARSAAGGLHHGRLRNELGEPEISHLNCVVIRGVGVVGCIQKVLRLEIAMGDADVVEVVHRVEHISSHSSRILLREMINRDDAVHHGSASDQIEDKVRLVGLVVHLVKEHAVGMRDLLHRRNLLLQRLRVKDGILLVDDLDGNAHSSLLLETLLHNSEGALADRLANLIGFMHALGEDTHLFKL